MRSSCYHENVFGCSGSTWTDTLGAVVKCMEEDLFADGSDVFPTSANDSGASELDVGGEADTCDRSDTSPDGTHFEVLFIAQASW